MCNPSEAPYTAAARPARPGADDREIVDDLLEQLADAEAVGQLRIGRIAKDYVVAVTHNRRLVRADLELSEQRVH